MKIPHFSFLFDLYFDLLTFFFDRPYSLLHMWFNPYRIDHSLIFSTSTYPDLHRYSLQDPSPISFYLASEGRRATKQLKHVFMDLCRPMSCVSKYGHAFSMNVIDDFSSYV